MKFSIISEAKLEFAESAIYYYKENPDIAEQFVEQIEKAVEEIRAHPLRYREELPGIRVRILEKFPYKIYYENYDSEVVILAITHQSRKPGHWLNRR